MLSGFLEYAGLIFVGLVLLVIVALISIALADADLALLAATKSFKPDELRGKVVWVTGASQGLGQILAEFASSAGAKVIISSRSSEKLEVRDGRVPTVPAQPCRDSLLMVFCCPAPRRK